MKAKNFWQQFKKPIYALAPMAGITDSAFRQVCKDCGADVVYSEMASATALSYQPEKTLEMLRFSENERPYVVQLFGSEPEHFIKAVKLLTQKPPSGSKSHSVAFNIPDGIDINFGCPVKKVVKQGAGAALMNNIKLSKNIIKAVLDNTSLPVSIKTRSAVGEVDILKFLDNIKDLSVKAVMIHGRTFNQGFSGPVDTEIIKKARDYLNGVILANGGVYNYEDAVKMLNKTKADGIAVAQGALGKPCIFKAIRTGQSAKRSPRAVYKAAIKHAELAEKLKGEQGIKEMRKHLCWYVSGLPGARKMRQELIMVKSLDEIRRIFK